MTGMSVPPAAAPGTRRPWSAWAWVLWGAAVAVQVGVASLAALYILFAASTTCRKVGTSANLTSGERALAITAAVLAVGWLIAALIRPARWPRMVLGCLLGVAPLVLVAVTHTRPSDWSGSFCF